ncbi:hypothetical protein MUK42_28128 [Musa troglodytarum]|uniref:Uncharacterized protein n=1 Tax=Musa troglodytarum TaxID=320322 RepID=A0A9E7FT73_9LILI|nr:hypothetical protein MUK42_28128 [Musa troglodytarum]
MALNSDSSVTSTAAPLPSGSITLSALATASIVLARPLNGSCLSTSSDSSVLDPSTPGSQPPNDTLVANCSSNGKHPATISLACLHVPSKTTRAEGGPGHHGGEGAVVPALGKRGRRPRGHLRGGRGRRGRERGRNQSGGGGRAGCGSAREGGGRRGGGGEVHGGVQRLRREVRAHRPLPLPFLHHRLFIFLRINAGAHRRSISSHHATTIINLYVDLTGHTTLRSTVSCTVYMWDLHVTIESLYVDLTGHTTLRSTVSCAVYMWVLHVTIESVFNK